MILVPLADPTVPWKRALGVWILMGVCALATLPVLFWESHDGHIRLTALDPKVLSPQTFLTHILVHGSLGHLLGNMLFLWGFGMRAHHRLGPARFLAVFGAAGVVGGAGFLLEGTPLPLVGASGAISGLMGLFGVLWPRSRLRIFVWFGKAVFWRPRAYWALGIWFLLQVLLARGKTNEEMVAYSAHIGGFLAGVAAGFFLRWRARRRRPRDRWLLEDPDERQLARARDLLAAVVHNLSTGHTDAARRAWDDWKNGAAHANAAASLREIAERFPLGGDPARGREAAEWASLVR